MYAVYISIEHIYQKLTFGRAICAFVPQTLKCRDACDRLAKRNTCK